MILLPLVALGLMPAFALGPSVGWTVPKVFTNGTGQVLRYRWSAPEKAEAGKTYPLVVLLHGAGERGDNNVSQLQWGADELLGYMRKNAIEGYFVAGQVPNGKQWVDTPWGATSHRMSEKPSETMALLFELLDRIAKDCSVDRSRIYVTGLSMGGYGTWDAVQRRPDFFAAALPCCGGGDARLARRIKDVPIWAWHGDCDDAVPVCRSRDMTAALWAVGGKIRYSEVAGCGHGVWIPAYGSQETLRWLFAQKRADVVRSAKAKTPNVLILGDSISLGYTPVVKKLMEGRANVSRPGTNCGPSQFYLSNMRGWVGTNHWDVIHVNFGIWDNHYLKGSEDGMGLYWGREVTNALPPIAKGTAIRDLGFRIRTPAKTYEMNLRTILAFLQTRADKVVFGLTTPLCGWEVDDRCGRIRVYNEIATEVCAEMDVAVDDLYSVAERNLDKQTDGCHYNGAGYQVLGESVVRSIEEALK